MADNTTINVGTGGDVIATDDLTTLNGGAVAGVKAQRVKIGFGSDGSFRDVDATNGLPVDITDGTNAITVKPTNVSTTQTDTALVVAVRPTPRQTYTAVLNRVATGALTANTAKAVLSIEHSAAATKTIRLRQLIVSGYATTAVAGTVEFNLSRGIAASTAGAAITPTNVAMGAANEATTLVKSLPTITAATVVYTQNMTAVPAAANSSIGSSVDFFSNSDQIEQQPFTLPAATLSSYVLNIISTAAINVTLNVTLVFTEE